MRDFLSLLCVTYSVRPDSEEAFRHWLREMNRSAASAPGFLGLEIARTASNGAGNRVIYKFDSDGTRDAWATASERTRAHEAGTVLFAVAPEESRYAADANDRVSMVVTSRVPAEGEKAWRAAQADLNAAAASSPGFEGLDIYESDDGGRTCTTVLTFRGMESLARWQESPERAKLLGRSAGAAEDSVSIAAIGPGPWFASHTRVTQPPEWKQAMVVLLVLYPLVSLFDITLGNAAGQGLSISGHRIFSGLGLPFPFVVFLGNTIGTVLLTWVLMPTAWRLFDRWLSPSATRALTIRGVLLFCGLYAVEIFIFVYLFQTWGF